MKTIKHGSAVAVVLASMFAMDGFARELHAELCPYGCPTGAPPTNDVVVPEIYVLSSNDTTKFADRVAYRVTADSIGPANDGSRREDNHGGRTTARLKSFSTHPSLLSAWLPRHQGRTGALGCQIHRAPESRDLYHGVRFRAL